MQTGHDWAREEFESWQTNPQRLGRQVTLLEHTMASADAHNQSMKERLASERAWTEAQLKKLERRAVLDRALMDRIKESLRKNFPDTEGHPALGEARSKLAISHYLREAMAGRAERGV